MDQLIAIPYQSIPKTLSHYTKCVNFKSILNNSGKNKEICFWANSNNSKNDLNELKIGKEIYDGVKEYLKSQNRPDYLSPSTNEKESFSISFTEGASNIYMIKEKEYGNLRLDFDLTRCFNNKELLPCEYITNNEIPTYINLFINEYSELFKEIQRFKDSTHKNQIGLKNIIEKYAYLDQSIREKIYLIKAKDKWSEEKEWRKIYYPDNRENSVYYRPNGIPFMKIYLPIASLVSVNLFNADNIDPEKSSYQYKEEFENYIQKNQWNIPVNVIKL